MDILKDDYVLGVWFAEKKDEFNWQLTILKRKDEWVGEYRFRYFSDDKVFNSDDRKSFYNMHIPKEETEEKILEAGHAALRMMKAFLGCTYTEYVEIKGDFEKMMFKLAQTNWCNVKIVKPEEAEKYGVPREAVEKLKKQRSEESKS